MSASSPVWMYTAEVAAYADCHPVTVRKAYAEYRRSGGQHGLRNVQVRKNAPHKSLAEWVYRWMAGEPPDMAPAPLRGRRRTAA